MACAFGPPARHPRAIDAPGVRRWLSSATVARLFYTFYHLTVPTPQIVIDTNILVAAQRSKRGASAKLIALVGTDRFDIHLSVPLVLEYEEVLLRYREELGLTQDDVADLVDALCALGKHHKIYFLWRPYLRSFAGYLILRRPSHGYPAFYHTDSRRCA